MAASPSERNWCVLEFARCNSFVAVRRAFRRQFGRPGPPETRTKFIITISEHFFPHKQIHKQIAKFYCIKFEGKVYEIRF